MSLTAMRSKPCECTQTSSSSWFFPILHVLVCRHLMIVSISKLGWEGLPHSPILWSFIGMFVLAGSILFWAFFCYLGGCNSPPCSVGPEQYSSWAATHKLGKYSSSNSLLHYSTLFWASYEAMVVVGSDVIFFSVRVDHADTWFLVPAKFGVSIWPFCRPQLADGARG